MKPTIYSIGHGNKPIELLISQLKEYDIVELIDVRSRPYSKYNPQYNRFELANSLHKEGISYNWLGRHLGGLDGNTQFDEHIDELKVLATMDFKVAIMCSETDHLNCHRFELPPALTPALNKVGVEVIHIGEKQKKVSVDLRQSML